MLNISENMKGWRRRWWVCAWACLLLIMWSADIVPEPALVFSLTLAAAVPMATMALFGSGSFVFYGLISVAWVPLWWITGLSEGTGVSQLGICTIFSLALMGSFTFVGRNTKFWQSVCAAVFVSGIMLVASGMGAVALAVWYDGL